MERDKFLQCRDEIRDVLKKHKAEGWTATRVLASALSEDLNARGYQMNLRVSDLPAFDEGNGKT